MYAESNFTPLFLLWFTVNTRYFLHGRLNTNQRLSKRKSKFLASIDDLISDSGIESDDITDQEDDDILIEDEASKRYETVERSGGRPGLISFYNQPYKKETEIIVSKTTMKKQSYVFWFVGPAVLVTSFIFPSLYMRKILSTVFEDSLLTGITSEHLSMILVLQYYSGSQMGSLGNRSKRVFCKSVMRVR